MTRNLPEIKTAIEEMLLAHCPPLQACEQAEGILFKGRIACMQGKQKTDGHYFASLIAKPKDIRFYFFPIYTHLNAYPEVSKELKRFLKGKSCFHILYINEALEQEVDQLIELGIKLYQKDGLI
jgi:hypothetical protein